MKMTTMKSCQELLRVLIVGALLASLGAPLLAQTETRAQTRLSGPIGGSDGQTLRVSVAVLPAASVGDGGLSASIEIYAADATDLEPMASQPRTPVLPGRSLQLDYDFGATREDVVVRLQVSGRGRDELGDFVASVQVFETVSGQNQLWGDWFIIRDDP